MKISVDNNKCEAHGMCWETDADLFPLDDDGYSAVGQGKEVPAGKEDLARAGVDACPMAALSIDEE